MSKLRIYITILTFIPIVGGAERQALAHARSLRERNLETTVVTFRHDSKWLSYEVIEGVPTIRVAGMLLGGREKLPGLLQKLLYPMALLVLSWTLWRDRHRYDVLHLYQLSIQALPVAFVCWLTGKPLIVSVRCSGSDEKTKQTSTPSLLTGLPDSYNLWLQLHQPHQDDGDLGSIERFGKPVVRFTHFLLCRIQAVIVILSTRTEGYLAAHDFNATRLQLIPNGVDITRFTPACRDAISTERAQTVICVSRLTYQKGIDVLLQAWCLIQKEVPQARLIIVGTGPLQARLERLAQSLNIQDSIEFAGFQPNVLGQLHRAGLAVLPSRFEGMSNFILEAMACGLACVATRVSGNEDIIQHGVNGLLVEAEDYQSLAQALLTLLRDPAQALKYGDAARASIEKHYSFEHVMDMYVDLYQHVEEHKTPVA